MREHRNGQTARGRRAPSLPAPRERLAARIVRGLGDRILQGALKPGDRLPSEHELGKSFGVSRAVVREAITSLKAEGLVATRQGAGAFVLKPRRADTFRVAESDLATLEEVLHMLELRVSVEAEAAGLAAQRRSAAQLAGLREALDRMQAGIERGEDAVEPDLQFHLRVAEATGNRHFAGFIRYVGRMLIPRARVNVIGGAPERRAYLAGVNLEHEEIYRAIAGQEPDAARAAMRIHLTRVRERIRAAYERRRQTTRRTTDAHPHQ